MLRVGFEPKIPVFEMAMKVHALERAATVIGQPQKLQKIILFLTSEYTNSYWIDFQRIYTHKIPREEFWCPYIFAVFKN
jgi:hypothetical protein